jgi:UPF0755 protein
MKKILLIILTLLLLITALAAWLVLGPGTGFTTKKEVIYIRSNGPTKEAVLDSLRKNDIVSNETIFDWVATKLDYWEKIRPGKYEIEKGASILSIVRKLRNGNQTPVDLVITKIRTKEDLARMTGNKFEFDSLGMMSFLNTNDSLSEFNIDTSLVMTLVLPDTYTYLWNSTPKKVFKKIAEESKKFWTEARKKKAADQGLTPENVYIVASIVEEETNHGPEKGNIASVYLNRVKKGMPLQADPTVKFALKDFSLKRIYQKHTQAASPYNTYIVKGLPPGPICTPSRKTIDAVLDAPRTRYEYFVASPKFDGTHDFSENYEEHLKKAKLYQQALNDRAASDQ